MCQPWAAGGLDIKPTRLINESLLLHLAWNFSSGDSQWARLLRKRFLKNGKPINHYFQSSMWGGIKEHMETVSSNLIWIVGTGTNIKLWTDNWLGISLVDLLHIPPFLHKQLRDSVADVIVDGAVHLPAALLADPAVASRVADIVLPTAPLLDSLVWLHSSDGKLTSKLALNFLMPASISLPWAALIWKSCIPPSCSFILWRIMHGKMPTDENLRRRGCITVSICNLCISTDESSDHLFLQCPFATNIWCWLGAILHLPFNLVSFAALLSSVPQNSSSQVCDIFVASVVHMLHGIWLVRNSLQFNNQTISLHSTKVRLQAAISFSGNISTGKCIASDGYILDALSVSPHNRRVSDLILVH